MPPNAPIPPANLNSNSSRGIFNHISIKAMSPRKRFRPKLTESQRERKREIDRKAQSGIRARRKNYIAYLEGIVESYRQNLDPMSTLAQENDRLRRAIGEREEKFQELQKTALGIQTLIGSILNLAHDATSTCPPRPQAESNEQATNGSTDASASPSRSSSLAEARRLLAPQTREMQASTPQFGQHSSDAQLDELQPLDMGQPHTHSDLGESYTAAANPLIDRFCAPNSCMGTLAPIVRTSYCAETGGWRSLDQDGPQQWARDFLE